MTDYHRLLHEIEEKNRKFHEQLVVDPNDTSREYDDDAYVEQELEIYRKYVKEGQGLHLTRPDGLKLSSTDVEDNGKLNKCHLDLKRDIPWIHELSQTSLDTMKIDDWENAIDREMAFYNDTLKTVSLSMTKLEKMGVPTVRPDDYFAEMVKSDEHMGRIKNRLLKNREIIRSRVQKRKDRDYKTKSKLLQAEAIQQKIQRKKDVISAVDQWRKFNKSGDTFDIQHAEKLYQKSKDMKNKKDVKSLYQEGGIKKGGKGKGNRPGKMARQKGKR